MRSSEMCWTVPATRSDLPGVRERQKSAALVLVIAAALAPRLVSARVLAEPGIAAFALVRAAGPEYRMMTGIVLLCASSRCSAIRVVTSNKVRSRRPATTSAEAAEGTTYVWPLE
ncbi:hypothetical protein GCM10022235_79810 [Kribbella ginsengisoli]|uniref:Secreted protein n=1 Tax=Kribbella ginsengisoli TaxID=363865 RepID=A0ABP6Z603_9ACTN